jgi:hypothetical protein
VRANSTNARGERANAELKNWKILRKIRSSPGRATELVQAVETLIITAPDQFDKGSVAVRPRRP